MHLLLQANSLRIPLADKSVHMCITSPPYWGLRDYGTATWDGGDAVCDHVQKSMTIAGMDGSTQNSQREGRTPPPDIQYKDLCRKCGARRIDNQLGLEPTPDEYIAKMVMVFREVWRVLRDDGTCWVNIGDSYNSTTGSANGNGLDGKVRGGSLQIGRIDRTVKSLKPKDLCGIPWRLAFALQADGWYLRSDIIWAKCLSGGTVVYAKTQKGEMPMTIKDMVRLDPATVKLWGGQKWNQIVGLKGSQRQGDEIEIELRNGAKIGSTLNHHWPVTWGLSHELVEARSLKVGDVLASCRLPEPAEPSEPEMLPPLDIGWFVGLYLAEGSQSDGTIQISGHVKEIERLERLEQIVKDYDGHCFAAKTSIEGSTININCPVLLGVIDTYISGRIASDKHLNPRCWKRSNLFLSSVLAGYLSGDGGKQTEDRWKLGFCDNDQLAADLRTLGARLGFSVRLRRCVHKIGEREYPGWRGTMVYRPEKRHYSDYEIVSITPSRARMFWDIALESEPHLFALANGVLTGNSNPMPESVTDRPTKSHEYLFLLSKQEKYYFDADAVREIYAREYEPGFGVGQMVRNGGIDHLTGQNRNGSSQDGLCRSIPGSGRNIRTVWTIPTESYPGSHFATFPRRLVEPCIKAGTSEKGCCPACGAGWVRITERIGVNRGDSKHAPGSNGQNFGNKGHKGMGGGSARQAWLDANPITTTGWRPACECGLAFDDWPFPPVPAVVLDPFIGSGTTIVVANALNRHSIGLDLSREYLIKDAKRRIERPHAPIQRPTKEEYHPLFGDSA